MPSFNHSLISKQSSNISFSNLSQLKFYAYNSSINHTNLQNLINTNHYAKPLLSGASYKPMHLQQTNLNQIVNMTTSQQSDSNSKSTTSSTSSYSSSSGLPILDYNALNLNNSTARELRPQLILTSNEERQFLLAQFTDTDLSCYVAPANSAIVNMDLVCAILNLSQMFNLLR